MRRPVTRGSNLYALLAAMAFPTKGGKPSAKYKKDKATAAISTQEREHWSWARPAAPGINQRKWRKKWRNAPHSRPKANQR